MAVANDIRIRQNGQWHILRGQKIRADGAWKTFGKLRAGGVWYELNGDLVLYPSLILSTLADTKTITSTNSHHYRQFTPITTGSAKVGRTGDPDNAKLHTWTGTTLTNDLYLSSYNTGGLTPLEMYTTKYNSGSLFSVADVYDASNISHLWESIAFLFSLAVSRPYTKVYLEFTVTSLLNTSTAGYTNTIHEKKNVSSLSDLANYYKTLDASQTYNAFTTTGAKSIEITNTTLKNSLLTETNALIEILDNYLTTSEPIPTRSTSIDIATIRLRFSNS